MSESKSRRDVIRWLLSAVSVGVAGMPALSAPARMAWKTISTEDRAAVLFVPQVPAGSKLVSALHRGSVLAAVYEFDLPAPGGLWEKDRWLCLAHEVRPGDFAVQTSKEAMYGSSNWHPFEATLKILDDGAIEVFEDGVRTHITRVWYLNGDQWQLRESSSMGVTAGVVYQQEYSQLTNEVAISQYSIEDDVTLLAERKALNTTYALSTFDGGPVA